SARRFTPRSASARQTFPSVPGRSSISTVNSLVTDIAGTSFVSPKMQDALFGLMCGRIIRPGSPPFQTRSCAQHRSTTVVKYLCIDRLIFQLFVRDHGLCLRQRVANGILPRSKLAVARLSGGFRKVNPKRRLPADWE